MAEHAIASTYTDGKTTIAIYEQFPEKSQSTDGNYETSITAGKSGRIQISSVTSHSAYTLYTGTFEDYPALSNGAGCAGQISIRRAKSGAANPLTAEIVWQPTSGTSCKIVGQTVRSTLREALPRPDKNGNFTSGNSTTYLGETSGFSTWLTWTMVDKGGSLNCRATPNGAVKRTYKTGQTVMADTRGGNAIQLAEDGSPWIRTRKQCSVRANTRYIMPASLPD